MLKKTNEMDVKHGTLPDPNQDVSLKPEHHDFRNGIPADVRASIEQDWRVELLFDNHPDYSHKIFIVKMISMATDVFVFIPAPTLRNKKLVPLTVEKLDGVGVFKTEQMDDLCDYVDYLKRDAKSSVVSSDKDYEFDIHGVSKDSIEGVAAKYYQMLKEYIAFNPELFPNESDNIFDDESCDGVRLTDRDKIKKYGENTYGISKKFLKDFWEVTPQKQKAIKTVWVNQELMFHGWGNQSQRDIKLRFNGKSTKLFVMKFDLNGEQTGHE